MLGRATRAPERPQLYERIFVGYGDDSVAQLGGAHIACEWVSNVLTKILQRPRLGAYLEQSTRYIAYDAPMPDPPGGYRYYRDPELGPEYARAMDELFAIYSAAIPRVSGLGRARVSDRRAARPRRRTRVRSRPRRSTCCAGSCRPSSLSHMGIFATGQTYEQLVLHLLAHPLPEARAYGEMILDELQGGDAELRLPRRASRPGRGVGRLPGVPRRAPASGGPRRLGLDEDETTGGPLRPAAARRGRRGRPARRAAVREPARRSEEATREAIGSLDGDERAELLADLVGAPRQPPPPTRAAGSSRLRYRFEIVSDYGAFRDLQRHRMLTVQWQALSPALGAGVPEQVELAGCGEQLPPRARDLEQRVSPSRRIAASPRSAPYALCLGYRIRYILDLNAREAMQLIELRSGREGHPSYRAVAHEMHAQIAAVHPAVAAAMVHVDRETEPRLERILSEMRSHAQGSGARLTARRAIAPAIVSSSAGTQTYSATGRSVHPQ